MLQFFDRIFQAILRFFRRLFNRKTPPSPNLPTVKFLGPQQDQVTDFVAITYEIADESATPAAIHVFYSVNGNPFQAATPAPSDPRHSGDSGLTTSKTGVPHTFVWDWQFDIPVGPPHVQLQLRASNGNGAGPTVLSGTFSVTAPSTIPQTPPSVQIATPTGTLLQGEYVQIDYELSDANSDAAYIEVYFSIDNGMTFQVASEANHPLSDGTSQLSTSPGGERHLFMWHAKRDLSALPADVRFKIQSFDHQAGVADVTAVFTVGQPTSNHPPTVSLLAPTAGARQGAVIALDYELTDDESDLVAIEVSYSVDQGLTFLPATEAFGYGSEGISQLSSGPLGVRHVFYWNAGQDLGSLPLADVIIQIQAFDNQPGGVATVGSIEVIDNLPPLIDIFSPTANVIVSSPVSIEYVLTDRESDICELEAYYSVDDGATFRPATSHNSGDGTSNLVSSDAGEVRRFVWDADRDLPPGSSPQVHFKIRVKDQFLGGTDVSDRFQIGMPSAPVVQVLQPGAAVFGSPVPVLYTLAHPNAPALDAEVQYSMDDGQTYQPATEAAQVGSGGLTQLQSSAQGTTHFFAWDIEQDLPGTAMADQLRIKISAPLGAEVGEGESLSFSVDTGYVGVPTNDWTAGTVPQPPEIHVFDPPDHTGIHAAVRFLLKQPDNWKTNVLLEFKVDNEPYRPATLAPTSSQLTNLAAPDIQADHKLIWNAKADLDRLGLTTGIVQLKLTPYVNGRLGVERETAPFVFTVKEPDPVPRVPVKTQYDQLSMVIVRGDGQEIIPGQPATEPLSIELRDANGEAVQQARITFSSSVNSQVPVTLTSHPSLRTTTDYYGKAGIQVIPEEGVEGPIQIVAKVVGMPGVSAAFNLESKLPKVVPDANNPTPSDKLEYGQSYRFWFYLDSETDLTVTNWLSDVYEPVEFLVSATNAETSVRKVRLPGPHGGSNWFGVDLTPSNPDLTSGSSTTPCQLKVEVLNMPGVAPYEETYFFDNPMNVDHLASVVVPNSGSGPRQLIDEPKRVYLKVISGHDPADPALQQPQTAFPGLTLSTPFQVQVVDHLGEIYEESTPTPWTIEQAGTCDGINLVKDPLKISWVATGGVLATSAVKGTDNRLEIGVNEKVYFTPTSYGPWSVVAHVKDYVYDKFSEKKPYRLKRQTGSGSGTFVWDPYCVLRAGFAISLSRAFFIHDPEVMGFEDVAKTQLPAPGPLLKQVKPGMKVRLMAHRISPVVGQAEEVTVKNVLSDGNEVKAYTGTSLTFNQKVSMQLDAQDPGILRSPELLVVQNEERSSFGIPLAVLPLSRLRAEVAHLKLSIKGAGLKRERLRWGAGSVDGDLEFAYESPVGTTPVGGALESLHLHNGEFLMDLCDLSFPSRAGNVQVCRAYRSMIQSLINSKDVTEVAEPLGPGWFFEPSMHLEVHHKHLRFWNGEGVYYDYPFKFAGRGQFIHIIENDQITSDRSAWEIRDRHRNYLHFNIDGTLRYLVDRFGNKKAFQYNEQAQLIEIQDCMLSDQRKVSLSYYPESQTHRDNQWVGRIKEISDFGSRKVSFEYYAEGERQNGREVGGAGLLKKVTWPDCETVMEGATQLPPSQSLHRAYERYEYEKDTRLGWRLRSVYSEDSKGAEQVQLTNHYDAFGRIASQEEGAGTFVLTFGADTVTYKDKNDGQTVYQFPPSPYWNATAPREVIDAENHKHELRHNIDGLLTFLKPPKGATAAYSYAEDSDFARQRANLLAEIVKGASGQERIDTYTYSRRFHFPITTVGPEGNLPGADPALHTFASNYDHQRNVGDAGNLVDGHGPRSLYVVYEPLPNDRRRPLWVEDEEGQAYTYNGFGQITSHVDERGIKTEYEYYGVNNPTGGPISPNGGGFLAKVTYDTEATAKRNLHLPGTDAAPQSKHLQYTYDQVGWLIESVDEKGIKTTYTRNKLGEIIKEEIGKGVKGLNLTFEEGFGPSGELTISKKSQAGTGFQSEQISYKYDAYGRETELLRAVNGTTVETLTTAYDAGDRVMSTQESQTGVETAHQYDKRNLETVRTVKSGTLTLTERKQYAENGVLAEETGADGEKTSYTQNEFGEIVQSKEESTGITEEAVLNEAGIPVVNLLKDGAGEVGAATEMLHDEYGRVKRTHQLRFKKGASAAGSGSFRRTPEYLGLKRSDYLSGLGDLIPDEGFAGQDGRSTVDAGWGIGGDLTQVKDDELGQFMTRFDGLGREIETDDRHGTRVNTAFDDASQTAETRFTATSDDPLFPEAPHTFLLKEKFNEAGVPEFIEDERGHKTQFDTDEAGKVTKVTNPEQSQASIQYNAFNQIIQSDLDLFVSGSHSDAQELLKGITDYNAAQKIGPIQVYDGQGQLSKVKDRVGNEFTFEYENDLLKKIIYPGSHGEEVFTYDPEGRLSIHQQPDGEQIHYQYQNGLVASVKNGQKEIGVQYNEQGLITELLDIADPQNSTRYRFDSQGNMVELIQSQQGQAASIKYQFDGIGRMIKEEHHSGSFLEYVYEDGSDALLEIRTEDGTLSTFEYYGDERKREVSQLVSSLFHFDQGRIKEEKISGLDGDDITCHYEFDELDRLIEKREAYGNEEVVTRYAYDNAGRVLKEELQLPSEPAMTIRYYYDADGVILKEVRDEFNPVTQELEKVEIERVRDELGQIVQYEVKSRVPYSPIVTP